ncbi:unnamed protein product, partial [Owenia fusiformis]
VNNNKKESELTMKFLRSGGNLRYISLSTSQSQKYSSSKTTQESSDESHTAKHATIPPMPATDFKPEPYKGIPYEKALQVRRSTLSPAIYSYYKQPMLISQGHMQYVWDHTGRQYLDLFGGIATVSVGHCHPHAVEAVKRQSEKLWHVSNIYLHPNVDYAEKLAAKLPDPLNVVYFVNSGSEANDLAMLMSRLHTGCFDVFSLRNGYHGASPYTMGLTAQSIWHYNMPRGFGVHQTMNPDVYRGIWGGANCRDSPVQTQRQCDCGPNECKACDMYIGELKDVLEHTTPKGGGIAAFFAESIQGVGGVQQYPRQFIKRAYDLVRAQGGLCVADEVQSGFGRTGGSYWGFESHGVIPDIVTMAKGIGNGFPMAALVTTKEIAQTMSSALHFNTYGANPFACAVGSAILDIIDDENILGTSKSLGTYILKELELFRDEFEAIGDVRGKGLMIGIELVTDKASKTQLSAEETNDIFETMKDHGILMGKGGQKGNILRVKPPMCITKEDADYFLAVFRQAITKHQNK